MCLHVARPTEEHENGERPVAPTTMRLVAPVINWLGACEGAMRPRLHIRFFRPRPLALLKLLRAAAAPDNYCPLPKPRVCSFFFDLLSPLLALATSLVSARHTHRRHNLFDQLPSQLLLRHCREGINWIYLIVQDGIQRCIRRF
jgi:hypothetical protein